MDSLIPMLVIEDSKPIASVIKHIAYKAGYQVDIASSYAQAQALLKSNKTYQLASVDYNLPDAQNGEAVDLTLSHQVPSIVLTGRVDSETRELILKRSVIDYIPKETAQTYLYLGKLLSRLQSNKKVRILVVDDSSSARSYICKLLKRHHFKISEAENGAQGLVKLQQFSDIKLVITDHEMPVMSGIRFVSEIRKRYEKDQLAIIALSGANASALSSRFIQNGANDFLPKSFCLEDFYCRVNQNIENTEYVNQIQRLANIDYLTGLINRQCFFQKAPKLIKRIKTNEQAFCIAMLDIDHFKQVNDQYGHDAGDKVIKATADCMTDFFAAIKHTQDEPLIARFGGEEFCLFIYGQDLKTLVKQIEQLRKKIAKVKVAFEDKLIQYTVSIGVAVEVSMLDVMITQADKALYQSKQSGRNKVSW
ncbi:GGDEF domain-containing response regulator [Catenovulum adriaticum]|uniref:diguanylate cyclase n=1 Tax=Catenovulum adriaticum TaxID=2984846 RepID=A0ABY7APX6_9ALTE|nr:response regulator [Catenovulum sp. TS8]WAJ70510.1 diguanylate cyclase [Catenovulum sp. TS8]